MGKMDNPILRRILFNRMVKGFSGKRRDLERLVEYSNKYLDADDSLSFFIIGLDKSLKENTPFHEIFLRVGKELSNRYKKRILTNLVYNHFYKGAAIRNEIRKDPQEKWMPNFVTISPTMRCNLHCTGCYSGLYLKDGELSESELDSILTQLKENGSYFVVISGGEPWIMKDILLRLFKKHSDMFFLTYTNSTLLDKETCKKLAKLGNVAAAISVEGWEEQTDARRGKGMWNKIHTAMANLRKEGVLFGISVTVTKQNFDVITDEKLMEHFLDLGAIFGWFFQFMPVGKDPMLELMPTPEQRVMTGKKVKEFRAKYPLFLADFWNDGELVSGCLAGGRQYLHILNSGNVEACVFAHFGVDNIRDKPLIDIFNSPFFKEIRSSFPYNENANLRRPCMIIDNPHVLRNAVHKHVAKEAHVGSEDIVNDEKVMKHIDNYSARVKELIDDEWEKDINTPGFRWYKEEARYKKLWEFQSGKEIPATVDNDSADAKKDQKGEPVEV
ncbi:MAG: radical SAM protein [Spirochaetales bacterium]|uniref:Radical SAM protein n=1 Tax=Candidatus Thalassospirochaeta sargassi TaxID=3119039 RepID=A0AAJ1MK10_9SPIO|nr:radical SAM protein [Spirochaetales bacterium]